MYWKLTFTDKNAITNAATSLSIWKLSATNAIELVMYPTTISTKKKAVVSHNIDKSRHFLPVNRPIAPETTTKIKKPSKHPITIVYC